MADKTKEELEQEARDLEIEGRSKMDKAELEKAVAKAEGSHHGHQQAKPAPQPAVTLEDPEDQAKAEEKVAAAAEEGWVRGGVDGPEDLEPRLRPQDHFDTYQDEEGPREMTRPGRRWTVGDDPEAALESLRAANVGTTGGPTHVGYYDADQQGTQVVAPTEEELIASQKADHARHHPQRLSDKEAKKAADEAKAG